MNFIFQGAAKRTIWRVTGTGNDPDPWRIPMRNAWQNGSNHWVGNVWSEETPDNRYPTLTMQTSINDYNYQCSSWSVQEAPTPGSGKATPMTGTPRPTAASPTAAATPSCAHGLSARTLHFNKHE